MADGHLGYVMPIGGVAAYRNEVSPIGVGVDIGCGNAAIRTDLNAETLVDDLPELADEIFDTIAFGPGMSNSCDDAPKDDPLFEDPRWAVVPRKYRGNLQGKARVQLGTTGGGNHYVDVFSDEAGAVWVGVHFGSRALGFNLAHNFVALAQRLNWGDRPDMNTEVLLGLDTPLGHDYWEAMSLAGEYAYTGRAWVTRKVVDILGGRELELVHNHHNFAWKEDHGGEQLVVVRKGATPAFPGQKGFVGGSMGDDSVIIQGSNETDDRALHSTVHGAGRVMGRMEAAGKWKRGRMVRPGKINHDEMEAWLDEKGVVLRGGDLDEAPQAYRRLPDVLAAQGDTIEVLHTLRPLIVCMAPSRTRLS
jgi:tRNA-splicing ligase RtcB